ncbi:Dynein heavy chain 1, axonemal [Homalodisca vitripennis]|nr:Dynein heavy chain 1, axonemal [Homalodisca vitripennis]
MTQLDIDKTRALYIPVANRGQILFFCLSDLASVDPMYQYSLEWFINIFIGSMINTEKTSDIDDRIYDVNEYLTFSLYSNVCRSLFEKNKLQFAFLLCVRIMLDKGLIDTHEWMFLLSGGSPLKVQSYFILLIVQRTLNYMGWDCKRLVWSCHLANWRSVM